MIKVPREDDEFTSGHAVLDKAMNGTKDGAQCFDVARENTMTMMGITTGAFSLGRLYHSSESKMIVSRHGHCINLGPGTAIWRRQKGQDLEQDCEAGRECRHHTSLYARRRTFFSCAHHSAQCTH